VTGGWGDTEKGRDRDKNPENLKRPRNRELGIKK
jgi:hypothetical protein